MNYFSDEQRRQTGWIGVQKCEVILKRALSPQFGVFYVLNEDTPIGQASLIE